MLEIHIFRARGIIKGGLQRSNPFPAPQKCQLYHRTFFFQLTLQDDNRNETSPHYAVNLFFVVTNRMKFPLKAAVKERDLFAILKH